MKLLTMMFLIGVSPLMASAPVYGVIVVNEDRTKIFEGASSNSKVSGYADQGDEFDLRAEKTYKGFYKILYKGHICFIYGGSAGLAEAPTVKATSLPTRKPSMVPTAEPTDEMGEEATVIPTRNPTRIPTAEPTDEMGEEATVIPTRYPTRIPTPEPTVEMAEEATVIPTRNSTRIPTPEPTFETVEEATVMPTRFPTRVPTAMPTPEKIEEATAVPTRIPAAIPTPVPTVQIRRAEGTPLRELQKVLRQVKRGEEIYRGTKAVVANRDQRRHSRPAATSAPQKNVRSAPINRKGQLSRMMFYVPLGAGKPYEVRPAFKPDAATQDSRNIDSSGFVGFGLDGRTWPWLRVFGDWTDYTHRTGAANALTPAPSVDLPGGGSVLSSSDIQYGMGTHGFRAGIKLGLPVGGWFEPWIGGGAGLYLWKAEYRDLKGNYSYGSDEGVEFGLTALAGMDFNVRAGGVIFMFTPFAEFGAPVVHPTVQNIAGLGVTWHDNQGTAVMVPRRLGLMLGLGF